ncbi:tRNA (adenosine(37)-N6)-threonylcarbamoyltransferase complex dimerization subunit type 1 TsaB [Akkermansiaceae bacterium]|nr:tRNA (adenosine(37)-N6)-threonylcarbamoyltransferase complex dimerization subunit type 1 TsaB [Akkermansiaceae bacterium]
MSAILILETSTDAASIALAVDGGIVAERGFVSDRRHNALLFSPLSEILGIHGRRPFDGVLVGSGPGSYSGTRVGIAAAQGAALAAGCKAVAVPSLLATPQALSGKPCLAVGDARRGSFWLARMEGGELLNGPELTDRIGFESALARAREDGSVVFCMDRISGVEIPQTRPTAAGLWQVWQAAPPQTRAIWAGKTPQPIYLAPPHITPSKKAVFGSGV